MTEPEPGPMFAGLINVTATATVTHPEGTDLTALDSEAGDENTENH